MTRLYLFQSPPTFCPVQGRKSNAISTSQSPFKLCWRRWEIYRCHPHTYAPTFLIRNTNSFLPGYDLAENTTASRRVGVSVPFHSIRSDSIQSDAKTKSIIITLDWNGEIKQIFADMGGSPGDGCAAGGFHVKSLTHMFAHQYVLHLHLVFFFCFVVLSQGHWQAALGNTLRWQWLYLKVYLEIQNEGTSCGGLATNPESCLLRNIEIQQMGFVLIYRIAKKK